MIRRATFLRASLPSIAICLAAACQQAETPAAPTASAASAAASNAAAAALPALPSDKATGRISADRLLEHVKALADDATEGRGPATHGEELAVDYIVKQMKALGALPGNPDGTYVQAVPLEGIDSNAALTLTSGGKPVALKVGDDYVATTTRFASEVRVTDSPLVFVGYGVQAPKYHWDDYKGLDARGKTLVMLINDPPIPDDKMFKGKAMTYYGRWTYKYEIASKLHADAVLIVHETIPAAYGWEVVRHSWSGEAFHLDDGNGNRDNVAVQGWITLDKAKELMADAGQDFDQLKAAALKPDFKPVALNATLGAVLHNKLRSVKSNNVIGLIPGSDPKLKDQYIVYTAHWDHLGRDRNLKGDQIFNGAVDNATGVAGLLEIGRAFHDGEPKPKRSVVLLSVTAEEQGLLGSEYYARHPLYPLAETLADFNMDSLNVYGRSHDFQVVGSGQNTLEDEAATLIAKSGRTLVSDLEPEKGHYFRSDQFNFAKVGVPALYAEGGIEIVGKPAGYGKQKRDDYTANRYHNVSDEITPDWDLSGAVEDMELLYHAGLDIANGDTWPSWRADSEFRQARENSLRSTPAPRH